jgi:hypothetical protein
MAGFEVITYGRFWVIAKAARGYASMNSPRICKAASSWELS